MSEINEMFFKEGTSLDGAIPGESLTVSPDDPRPWESPPQIVTKSDAYLSRTFSLHDSSFSRESAD